MTPGRSPLASITFVYLLAISTAVRDLKPHRGRGSPELTIDRKPSLPLTYYGMLTGNIAIVAWYSYIDRSQPAQ